MIRGWQCFAFTFAFGSALARAADAPPPVGKLVDIGGYKLHGYIVGTGSPTVVLVAGAGDFSFDWSTIQSRSANFTRVVSYDRAGVAWSDAGPIPRTFRQEAHELRRLLANADIPGPYVLVGHSVGGLIARIFAIHFPADVAGMVLVDPTHENGQLFNRGTLTRMTELARGRPIPPVQTLESGPPPAMSTADRKEHAAMRQQFGPPRIRPPFDKLSPDAQQLRLWAMDQVPSPSGEDLMPEEMLALAQAREKEPRPLGDRPLVVLVAAKATSAPREVHPEEWIRLQREKIEQKMSLAKLSSRGRAVRDDHSGHHLYLDNPDAVVAAIREVVEAARPH